MSLRELPSVERLVQLVESHEADDLLPRAELVSVARVVLATTRERITNGSSAPSLEELAGEVSQMVAELSRPRLRPIINATGVVVQTNLGRAPLSPTALAAVVEVAGGYSNLEYDLDAGERGSRYAHMGGLLARLTGAEAALVVNNNAAAVLLVLSALCVGREVLVSRGQAVEIGGGFRIPDILRQSGATLIEVGTTNRTYARDYAEAVSERTVAILTVHRSNFRISGFTHDPSDAELGAVAREHNVLWIDDWGSGSLLPPAQFGLLDEPTVADRVRAGCDLVCFSGDKLLGGPQAGVIAGKAASIARLRKHPLLRALRVDKLTIAAMEATLLSYLRGRATEEIPVWQMIATLVDKLAERAASIVARLQTEGVAAEVKPCQSAIGGGSTPGETLPSVAVALVHGSPDDVGRALRAGDPPVVGRIVDDQLLLDLRTVRPEDDVLLVDCVIQALRRKQER